MLWQYIWYYLGKRFGNTYGKIGLLLSLNLTLSPWDYKKKAQDLTSGAICMFLSFFGKIWEHFKDGRVGEKRNPTFFAIFESTWSTSN